MTLVAIMTRTGVYQGDLELVSPVGQPLRLLDALNHPGRLKQREKRAVAGVELTRAARRDLQGGQVTCGELVSLRGDEILAAYEASLEATPGDSHATVYEDRQLMREAQQVFLLLENGFRLVGEIGGGFAQLDLAKPGKHFVGCYEVRLMAPGRDTVLELPFMAVNALRLEASGLGNPW